MVGVSGGVSADKGLGADKRKAFGVFEVVRTNGVGGSLFDIIGRKGRNRAS